MIIREPKWKSYAVETTGPIFTSKLCQEIIDLSKTLEKQKGKLILDGNLNNTIRKSTINWIPFDKMQLVYTDINSFIQKTTLEEKIKETKVPDLHKLKSINPSNWDLSEATIQRELDELKSNKK